MLVHVAACLLRTLSSSAGSVFELRTLLAYIAAAGPTLLGERGERKEWLRLRNPSGNLPCSVMVHNDVAFHLGTLSPDLMRELSSDEPLDHIYHLLYCILVYLAQSTRTSVLLTKCQTAHTFVATRDHVVCPYTRDSTTCPNALLYRLVQFHSWSCRMEQILR